MLRTVVSSSHAPAPIGPYAQAIAAGNLIFTSGQIGLDPASGTLVNQTFAAEVRRVLDNLSAVLTAAGSSLDAVVKTTVYVTDLSLFGELNAIYAEYFAQARPARSTVQVAALPAGARVEIDAVALR